MAKNHNEKAIHYIRIETHITVSKTKKNIFN